MTIGLSFRSRFSYGKATQSANTAITQLIPPLQHHKTIVTVVQATAGGTAHVLTLLRPLASTTLTAAVAAGSGYVLPLAADPGMLLTYPDGKPVPYSVYSAINFGDYFALALPDGTFFVDTVLSWDGTRLNLSMNGTLPTNGAAAGARVWWFANPGSVDPLNPPQPAHAQLDVPANATTTFPDADSGLQATLGHNSPILIHDNNVTAAGVLEFALGGHMRV
jgi:hypothetical protein